MASVDTAGWLVDISTRLFPNGLDQIASKGLDQIASKVLDTIENGGRLTAVAADAYLVGKTIYTDSSETKNRTIESPSVTIHESVVVTIPTKRPGGDDIIENSGTACVKEHGKRFEYEGIQCPFKLLSGVECTWTGSLAEVDHFRLHHGCETQDNTGPFAVKLQNVSKSNNFHKMLFLSDDLFYLLWVIKDDILYFLVYLVPKDDSADYTYDFKILRGKQEVSVTGGTCGNFRHATSTVLENGDIIRLHSSTVQRYLDENDALTCVIEIRKLAAIHSHRKVPDTTTDTLLEQPAVGPQQASCCSSKQSVHNRRVFGFTDRISEISNAKIRRVRKSLTLSKRNMNTKKKMLQTYAMLLQQAALKL